MRLLSQGRTAFAPRFLACVAGVRRGGKGERRASEAREDFDFPPSFSTACHAGYTLL